MIWLLLSPALAYDLNSSDWSWQDAPIELGFSLHEASFQDLVAPTEAKSALDDARLVWNSESGANVILLDGGTTDVPRQGGGSNNINSLIYGGSTFYSSLAVATTSTSGGRLLDCDIRFYKSNLYGQIDWYVGTGQAGGNQLDLRHTMIHELGHCIGLGHSNVDTAIMGPTNSPGSGDERRHLQPDDIAGAQALYGAVFSTLAVEGAVLVDGPGEGEATVQLSVRNQGDGSAWLLQAQLTDPLGEGALLGMPSALAYIDVIGAPTPVGRAAGPDLVALSFTLPRGPRCTGTGSRTLSLDLFIGGPSFGPSGLPLAVEDPCVAGGGPDDTGAPSDTDPSARSEACGCDQSVPGRLPWALALLSLAFWRRKYPSAHRAS